MTPVKYTLDKSEEVGNQKKKRKKKEGGKIIQSHLWTKQGDLLGPGCILVCLLEDSKSPNWDTDN